MFDTQYTRDTKDKAYDLDVAIYSKEKPTYHLVIDKFGHQKLEQDGVENIYDKIQAYHDGCALKCILARYKETGDVSLLNRKSGAFFDSTDMPDSLLGMYKKVNEGKEFFNNLPLEVRQQFNNDFGEFLAKGGVINDNKNNDIPTNDSGADTKTNKRTKKSDSVDSEVENG